MIDVTLAEWSVLLAWLFPIAMSGALLYAEWKDAKRAAGWRTETRPPTVRVQVPILWLDPPRRITPKFERLNLEGCAKAGDSRVMPFRVKP